MIAALFGLALIHQLTPSAITTTFILLTLAALLAMYASRKPALINFQFDRHHLVGAVFVSLLIGLQYASIAPPSLGDSTSFHLPYADVFIRHQGLAVEEHLIYPYMSLNGSLLYSLALMIGGHDIVFAQSVNALFATLTLYGIYRLCLFTRQALWLAILAPFLFVMLYPVNIGRHYAYVDLMAMFFIFVCIFMLLIWSKHRDKYFLLLLSAIALGIAMGTKYIMGIFAFPIAIYIFWHERKRAFRPLLIYGGCAALWGLWWYIRNVLATGNPVHPFAPDIFGYYLWDEGDLKRQFMGLDLGYVPQNFFGFVLAPAFAFFNEILMDQDIFIVLAALYISAALARFSTQEAKGILLFCFCFLVFWVFGTSDPRYLLPVIPLVCVYTGSVIDGLTKKTAQLAWFSLTALVTAFMIGAIDIGKKIDRLSSLALLPDAAHEQLSRENPTYDLIMHANVIFGSEGRVFEFYYRDGRFFSKNVLLGTQFGQHAYWRLLNEVRSDREGVVHYDPEKLLHVLKTRYDADGFIIPNPAYFKNHYDQAEFEAVFDLVYQNADGSIYRIRVPDPAAP